MDTQSTRDLSICALLRTEALLDRERRCVSHQFYEAILRCKPDAPAGFAKPNMCMRGGQLSPSLPTVIEAFFDALDLRDVDSSELVRLLGWAAKGVNVQAEASDLIQRVAHVYALFNVDEDDDDL